MQLRIRYRAVAKTARYLVGRLLTGVGTLLVVTLLVFGAVHLLPGSYADVLAGPFAPPATKARIANEYGLNRPLPIQYVDWLKHVATGDFGSSLATGVPVSQILSQRFPVTGELALLAVVFALLVGVPAALLSGLARRRATRETSRFAGAVAMSTPDFVLGSIFVYLFSRYGVGLSIGGYVPFSQDPIQNLSAMVLPALTLSVFGIALVVRIGRDSVTGVLSSPHVTAAIGRGESMRYIVRRHVIRNAAIPVVTVLATYVGYLMGGAIVVETLFSLPGLGQAALDAVKNRDYAIIQGVVLAGGTAFIALNMLADASYSLLDPRVRRPSKA
jgi:peptide/nickel transport system permease protein